MLVFKARFKDGFAFETSNSRTAPIFRPDPQFPFFRFPQIRFHADLYRIHQKIKERFTTNRCPVVANKSEELNDFLIRAEKLHERNAARDYKLNAAGDRYIFTLRGAIRRAWLQTWPVKPIRALRVQSKAMKTALELGLPIHPKFGRLQDSLRRHDAAS